MKNCGHCHECGVELKKRLDGEEWCPSCQQYCRYKSHGWGHSGEGEWDCPSRKGINLLKSKFYVVDLDTKKVELIPYNRFWEAIETEKKAGRTGRFTAIRGQHIMEHLNKPWLIG